MDIECLCQMNILLRVSRSDISSVASLGRKVSSESSYEENVLFCDAQTRVHSRPLTSNIHQIHIQTLLQLCHWLNSALLQTGPGYTREVLSFINLSIILVQFNNMQGPLQYLTKATQMRLCGSPNQQRKRRKCHYKKGYTSKRRQEVLVFNTTSLARWRQAKVYNNQGSAWADIQAIIETALRPFHQDKMCALKAKDGNRE